MPVTLVEYDISCWAYFFFSSRRRHTRCGRDWSSDVCSSDLAVSGLPKEYAYKYIDDHEGYNRKYYTGFLGMIDLNNETNIYVNLRCMEIGKSLLTLFSGSGLVLSSTSRDEWKETEQKLKTMASIVN